jgi:hypothetical protein
MRSDEINIENFLRIKNYNTVKKITITLKNITKPLKKYNTVKNLKFNLEI